MYLRQGRLIFKAYECATGMPFNLNSSQILPSQIQLPFSARSNFGVEFVSLLRVSQYYEPQLIDVRRE